MENQTEASPEKLDLSTKLAIDRTRVAHERTMMAWTRTATSLITFGFAVYKFFDIQRPSNDRRLIGSREFGGILVCIGLFSLLLATLENQKNMRTLRAHYPETPRSMATLLAGVISLLGILALLLMIIGA